MWVHVFLIHVDPCVTWIAHHVIAHHDVMCVEFAKVFQPPNAPIYFARGSILPCRPETCMPAHVFLIPACGLQRFSTLS